MKVEVINTGSELLLGRLLNTHQLWLCRRLSDLGYQVCRQSAVLDSAAALREAIGEAMERVDLVVTTGGLGPTSDDLTRSMIAELLGRSLHEDSKVARHIRVLFRSRRRRMPESVLVQALVPEGAEVLMNAHGTAPGLLILPEAGRRHAALALLPGPPRELYPMVTDQLVPLLRDRLPPRSPTVVRTWRTTGLGESRVAELIEPRLSAWIEQGLSLGYCCRPGEVDVRLQVAVDSKGLMTEAGSALEELLGAWIYGVEDDLLETALVAQLARWGETVALAESCTGGHVANRLTNIPGASEVFLGGVVCYSNASKVQLVGVPEQAFEQHGAVSEPVAAALASGARERFGSTYGLSATGIAGPSGGTSEKPVGTVCLGLATPGGVLTRTEHNQLDRETFKYVTAQQLLDWLRREAEQAKEKRAEAAR